MRLARLVAGGRRWLAREHDGRWWPILEQVDDRHDPLVDALSRGTVLEDAPTVADPVDLSTAALVAPIFRPSKICAIGLNYRDHARETAQAVPERPLLFLKAPSSIVGPGQAVTWSAGYTNQVDYEAELAAVIGRTARNVPLAHALDHVAGYTAANDVSARDLQFADGQWARGKSLDSFCPLGPWIVTAAAIADPQQLEISCTINGRTLQAGTTADMVFGVAEIVASLSTIMTLEPGDIILTGTPAGVGFTRRPPVTLADGDQVVVQVGQVGELANPVVVVP